MNIINELEAIKESEINFTIEHFYDAGWAFKLGDVMNGYTWDNNFSSFIQGVNSLIFEILNQYPDSEYTKNMRKRRDSVFYGLPSFEVKNK